MDIQNLCPNCMRELKPGDKFCQYCGYQKGSEEARSPHVLKPFTILQGKYLVGNVLGEGGFGISYIGFDLNLEIRIAIKEFYPNGFVTREADIRSTVTNYTTADHSQYEKWKDSFVREARSLAKFSDLPGIVHVRDYFQENNTAYITMDFISGETLKEHLKKCGGKMSVDATMSMMLPVIQSLARVHEAHIIHRDISPDNIMVDDHGNIRLIDFGAARDFGGADEKSLSVLLKPGFAPEEQYRSKGNQGPWTDVYALCATIYRCITGEKPPESMERMRADTIRKPSSYGIRISASQEAALMAGLEVFAENRIQSMGELEAKMYGRTSYSASGNELGTIPDARSEVAFNNSANTQYGDDSVMRPLSGNNMQNYESSVKPANGIKGSNGVLIGVIAALGVAIVALIGFIVFSNMKNGSGSDSDDMNYASRDNAPDYSDMQAEPVKEQTVETSDDVVSEEAAEETDKATAEVMQEDNPVTEEVAQQNSEVTEEVATETEEVSDEFYDESDEAAEEISSIEDEYILYEADSRIYPKSLFESMTDEELRLARNEIYARHGRTFNSEDLQEYFNSKSWYRPEYTPEEFDSMQEYIFNDYEKANRNMIKEVESSRK
ncbi:protein kinase domain-containing protein [Butyrivibrio sp. AE3004]|uniref:protein kinase domain-containing protein n=1 Tax=Butyrivibrio sp. AE3004 TaxID=1506994 RepID=UPI00069186D9|nr:YARHG domain-containing protein [Butyrivibrio sp. AE3004]